MFAPMVLSRRHGLVFAAGLLFGVVAGAALVLVAQGPESSHNALKAASAQQQQPVAAAPLADCGFEPLLAASNDRDGRFRLEDAVTNVASTDIPAYLTVGTGAAAQGRLRDAEVAYITSCRIAARAAGGESAELADAKYHLAQHYVKASASMTAPEVQAARDEALKRAEALFSESIDGYGIKFGVAHEKTAMAAAGLASVKEATAIPEFQHAVPRILLEERVREYAAIAADPTLVAEAPRKPKRKVVVDEEPAPEPATVARSERSEESVSSSASAGSATREMGGPPDGAAVPDAP